MESHEIHEKLEKDSKDWNISEEAVKLFKDSLPNIISLVNDKFKGESGNSEEQ